MCEHNPRILLPFKSCSCRPFRACIQCWVKEQEPIHDEVQCAQRHPITDWKWLCLSPVFWVRFYPGLGGSRLKEMGTKTWTIRVFLFHLLQAALMATSLYLREGMDTMFAIIPMCSVISFFQIFCWNHSSPWSLLSTLVLSAELLVAVFMTRATQTVFLLKVCAMAASVLAFCCVSLAFLRNDFIDFYKCYVVVIATLPEGESVPANAIEVDEARDEEEAAAANRNEYDQIEGQGTITDCEKEGVCPQTL